ncbi:MAG: YncE family protein [Eubacteriales bacterium]
MNKYLRIVALIFALVMLLCACKPGSGSGTDSTSDTTEGGTVIESSGETQDTTTAGETEPQTETEPETEPPAETTTDVNNPPEDEPEPSAYISADKENTVTLKHIMNINSIGNHNVLQGACTDGKYAYVILENQKVDPHLCIIRKIELETWKVVADSQPLAIDHGNDICYNSKTGMLVVSHNAPDRTKVSFINPDTLEVTETIKIDYEIYSITYNPKLDRYALGISHGYNFVIVDSNFKYVGKKIIAGKNTGFTKQGMDSDSKYIYFVQSWENCIVVYDWEGNHIKTINFEDKIKHESEAIFHFGESFYITFNVDYKTYGALYKVDIR